MPLNEYDFAGQKLCNVQSQVGGVPLPLCKASLASNTLVNLILLLLTAVDYKCFYFLSKGNLFVFIIMDDVIGGIIAAKITFQWYF